MCELKKYKDCNVRIDNCMKPLIRFLQSQGMRTKSCCCGHGKYPMTIVIETIKSKKFFEILKGVDIPRTRNFYKRDKQGYYFIPEVSKEK